MCIRDRAEFFNEYGALLWEGTLETLYMTLFATLFAYVLGLPMGVLLTVTKAGGVAPAPRFNAVLDVYKRQPIGACAFRKSPWRISYRPSRRSSAWTKTGCPENRTPASICARSP